jgi:hypothetical protein
MAVTAKQQRPAALLPVACWVWRCVPWCNMEPTRGDWGSRWHPAAEPHNGAKPVRQHLCSPQAGQAAPVVVVCETSHCRPWAWRCGLPCPALITPAAHQYSVALTMSRWFLESMPMMYWKRVQSSGTRGREREVRCTPRRLAAGGGTAVPVSQWSVAGWCMI